jgi:hypothetical protein
MTMKRTPPLLTVLILSLLVGRAVSAGKAQTIQIGILQIPVASLELVESNSIPESATFYLLKDALELGGGSAVPCPTDPYPQYPTYSIVGLSGIYLVDNTGISGESIQEIMSPLEITPDPNAPAPEIDWPLSLSSLALVDPASVPDFGTFFLYTDQTNDDMPPPYPWNPCSTCPVYSLGITNLFLVDDSGWIRPQGDWTPNYTAPVYGTNLALYIIGVSDYTALLVLTNTVPGTDYEIEYKQNLADPNWGYAGTVSGPSNQDWTPIVVPVGTLGSVFFRAHVAVPVASLWLEVPPGDLNQGWLNLILHNTQEGQPYDVLAAFDLSNPISSWNLATNVIGDAGSSTTVQLPTDGQGNLFVCARFAGDTQGTGIPDWWWFLYVGYIGDPYALDPSGDG